MKADIAAATEKCVIRMAQSAPAFKLSFFGGEPLLAPDLVLRFAKAAFENAAVPRGYRAEITTNGGLLTPKLIAELGSYNLKTYQITLDGPRKVHDVQRPTKGGKGTFDVVLRAFDLLYQSDIPDLRVTMRVNVHPHIAQSYLPLLEEPIIKKVLADKRFNLNLHEIWGSEKYVLPLVDDVDSALLTWKEVQRTFINTVNGWQNRTSKQFLNGTLGREALLLAWSVNNAAEAYLMHRLDLFEDAHKMVQIALDADEELERVYGYGILMGHRIQLVHNSIRVAAREQNFHRAYELLGSTIAFIEGYGHSIPLHHSWVASRLPSDSGWAQMERQLIRELAISMFQAPPEVWPTFCGHLQLSRFLVDGTLDLISRKWVALKDQFVRGDTAAFLEAMPGLLKKAFAESRTLFFSVLWDYYQILSQNNTPLSRALQIQLLRDSRKWSPPAAMVAMVQAARAAHLPEESFESGHSENAA